MKNVLKLVVLVSALLIAPVSSALADSVIDQQQDVSVIGTANSSCQIMGPDGVYNVVNGSTFTPSLTGSLTRIDIAVASISGAEPFWIRVYNTSSHVPSGTPIAVQQISTDLITANASGGTLSIIFDSPTDVTEGTQYAFAVGADSCSSGTTSLNMQMGITEGHDTLVQYQSRIDSWVNDGYYGINYATYVDVPTVIPTPSPTAEPTLAETGSSFDFVSWFIASFIFLAAGITFIAKARKN